MSSISLSKQELNYLGDWNIQICLDGMPEKIASAIIELNEQLIGAKYRPIAYLGSQKVKGTNFAVLAEQKILDADNTKNIVLVVFNEAPHNIKATLVYIKPVLNGFLLPAGGIHINDKYAITDEAQAVFDSVMKEFVGSKVEPFAFLATQITDETNYTIAAVVTPVNSEAIQSVELVTVNIKNKFIHLKKII